MATPGAITGWLRSRSVRPITTLVAERRSWGRGGLIMLPYFAGRTPDGPGGPRCRGGPIPASHTRGDLYRSPEATGFAVRHNIEAIEQVGGSIERIVAVGGGTKSDVRRS